MPSRIFHLKNTLMVVCYILKHRCADFRGQVVSSFSLFCVGIYLPIIPVLFLEVLFLHLKSIFCFCPITTPTQTQQRFSANMTGTRYKLNGNFQINEGLKGTL